MKKTPKQILIFTECHWFSGFARNAGSYRIATELRNHGYSVQVIDFFGFLTQKDFEKIIEKFVDEATLAICFSSTFFNRSSDTQYRSSHSSLEYVLNRIAITVSQDDRTRGYQNFPFSDDIIQEMMLHVKCKYPNIKFIYGGSKAQYQQIDFMDCLIVDFGENSILEYLNSIKSDLLLSSTTKQQVLKYKLVDTFDYQSSEIVWTKEDLIFPNETLPIEISRGCIFSCKFCNYLMLGKKNLDHVKHIETLKREFERNFEEHGVTNYIFCDDTFNDSTEKLRCLSDVIQQLPFPLTFTAYLRPELTYRDPTQLNLLKNMGLRFAKMGIESLNTATRKAIGKGTSITDILKCLENMKKCWGDDVITSGSFVFGLPNETKESLEFQEKWIINDALDFIHSASVMPLYLNFSETDTINKSYISANYEEYGYSKIDDGRGWYNSLFQMSFYDMKIIADRVKYALQHDQRFKHGGFSGSMIQNTGITFEEIRSQHFTELPYYKAQQNYADKITYYKEQLFNL